MPYQDLREYLATLEAKGLLHRVTAEVDRDWEIAAVSRILFQKVPAGHRPAISFERVRGFRHGVVAGVLGASRAVYATALECPVSEISSRWIQAQKEPIEPVLVAAGACQENVLTGADIDLLRFPVPVWSVGQDPGPYLTAPFVVSKDPETGIPNVGTYRIQVKGPAKVGCMVNFHQHLRRHVELHEARGLPTPVAIVLGTEPTFGLTSVSRIPYGVSEFAVAGGLRGEALPVVKCVSTDLEVPATAEIVLEGEITGLEHEGPFGEYTGYMGPDGDAYVVNLKALTFRHNAILQAFISQMPPSESSLIRSVGREAGIAKALKEDLRLPVTDVRLKESGGAAAYLVISIRKGAVGQVQQAAWGAWAVDPTLGKFTVVVDDDIDIWDDFAVDWALSFRVQPARDCYLVRDTAAVRLDPSIVAAEVAQLTKARSQGSKILIDATKKHSYPATALPPQEHLAKVLANLERYNLRDLVKVSEKKEEGGSFHG